MRLYLKSTLIVVGMLCSATLVQTAYAYDPSDLSDPLNPSSPYNPGQIAIQQQQQDQFQQQSAASYQEYLNKTPKEKCDLARYTVFCTLGIACLQPPGINCGHPITPAFR